MTFKWILVGALLTVASCSTTSDDLISKSTPVTETVSKNYQSIYRDLSKQLSCRDGAWAGAFASYEVDKELYPDLGFAEISLRMSNVGVNNFYNYTRITKLDSNTSKVEVYAGNTLQSEKDAKFLLEIANGSRKPKCG